MRKEYDIETVLDFTKVPKNKVGKCLSEFAIWVLMMQKAKKTKLIRAGKTTGIATGSICFAISGRYCLAGGYKWEIAQLKQGLPPKAE